MSAQGSSPGRRHSPCKYESNGYAQATRLCRPAWIRRDESLLTLLAMFSIGVVVKGTGIQVNALGKLQRTGETGVSVCLAVPFTSMTTPTVLEKIDTKGFYLSLWRTGRRLRRLWTSHQLILPLCSVLTMVRSGRRDNGPGNYVVSAPGRLSA